MKKSMKFATAMAGAAVVVVGGTAFTANTITGMPANSYVGTGSTTVSGVAVDAMNYTYTDGKVSTITWEVEGANTVADVTVTSAVTTTQDPAPVAVCPAITTAAGSIVCNFATPIDMTLATGISLTVTPT